MSKPFESTVQDLVYNMDVGVGLQVIKKVLFFVILAIVITLYSVSQFHGLKDAEAIEYAQLGRNLMVHHKMVTQCIRPVSLWYLTEYSSLRDPQIEQHPDILHPPLYPALLAAVFKISRVSFVVEGPTTSFTPEKLIVAVNLLFALLTGWIVFLMGKRLFDRRAAILSVLVYFLSDSVLGTAISGLGISMVAFLAVTACYLILVAFSWRQDAPQSAKWMLPFIGAAILCALAVLTRYGVFVIVPALAVFIGVAFTPRSWRIAVVFVVIVLVALAPWMIRNKVVSGGFFGLAPYMALSQSNLFDDDLFERSIKPFFGDAPRVINALQAKWLTGFAEGYNRQIRLVGDGLLIGIFFAMFFHRFVRSHVRQFRWCLALALGLWLVFGSFFGESSRLLLAVFWPLIILYALAFFLVLLERLQFQIQLYNLAAVVVVVVLCAIPMILTLLPPRSSVPYPPYFPPYVSYVSNLLTPQELMCTDMPWATAWYGNRTSVLLPATLDQFYSINDIVKRFKGLYITTLTRDKPYARTLVSGNYITWFPILEGKIPGDFPLAQGFTLPPNSADQVFLTDRMRWKE